MWSAASVLVCALSLLGRSERSMPPIELIEIAPPEVSVGAEAFVRQGRIHLITSSPVFREAADSREQCTPSQAVKKLASILAHEEWHVLHGGDEKRAYERQLSTLIMLDVRPGSLLFYTVQKSMLKVLEQQKRNRPDLVVAGRR
jgi:hypothetical protein